MNVAELRTRLDESNIIYERTKTKKPELQSLCALSALGFLADGSAPHPTVIAWVRRWYSLPLAELQYDLADLSLEKEKTKWGAIEALITAE